jgi:hypothetical protein
MTARKCLLLVFGLACMVSDHCIAGPVQKDGKFFAVCTPEEQPEQRVSMPSPFPRSGTIPNLPTIMFALDDSNLTHRLTAPPEFRVGESKPAKATGVILQTWPLQYPRRQAVDAVHPSAWGQTI